jgi:hypothetical protein
MSEHDEQKKFVMWAMEKQVEIPQINALFSVPNAGLRNMKTATYFIVEGLKSGVPDLFLAYPVTGYAGLFIEFKFGKNKLSKNQIRWRQRLEKNGYAYHVFYSSEEAIRGTLFYLDNQFPRKE